MYLILQNGISTNLERQLLTMAQIAKQLELAESTVRFYRTRFENYIPSVIEMLRFIAEGYNHNGYRSGFILHGCKEY